METILIKTDPSSPGEAEISRAADIIRNGGLVIFPTETVYGIGGDATDPESARKIYAAKGRPSDNPLIIHIASPEEAEGYAVTCPLYYRLARAFMPGPITVILEKKDIIPFEVTGGLATVAVRCPSHPVANMLIRLSGVPVAAPSANVSGRPSATDAATALSDFDGKVDCLIDGGDAEFGLESTIVKITGDDSLLLLRPGAVTADALRCVCSDVKISDTVERAVGEGERPVCPGMKYRHYAPAKPLALVGGTKKERLEFFLRAAENENCVFICYDEQAPFLPRERTISLGSEKDLLSQGHLLFSALRHADVLPGERIYANLPPRKGLGLALRNRLIRAAAHTVVNAKEKLK